MDNSTPAGALIATYTSPRPSASHNSMEVWELPDGTFNLHTLGGSLEHDPVRSVRHFPNFFDLYTWLQLRPEYGVKVADRLIDAFCDTTEPASVSGGSR